MKLHYTLPLLIHSTEGFTSYIVRHSNKNIAAKRSHHTTTKLNGVDDLMKDLLNVQPHQQTVENSLNNIKNAERSSLDIDLSAINDVINLVNEQLQKLDDLTDQSIVTIYNLLKPLSEQLTGLLPFDSEALNHQLQEFQRILLDSANIQEIPFTLQVSLSAFVTYSVFSLILQQFNNGLMETPNSPYPDGVYNDVTARLYFEDRPLEVVGRFLEIMSLSTSFLLKLGMDFAQNKVDENAEVRAEELAVLLTKLGPSFIKIGQSLSIRTDILSPAYVRGLKSLQDQVPAFPTDQAIEIIENDLGRSIDDVFADFPSEPVAAASLGQVYRATLRDVSPSSQASYGNDVNINKGPTEVAVKVQRPNITNQIALDMFIIRDFIAPFLKKNFNLNTDLVGVTDTWGKGFVDELNYLAEAENARTFTQSIQVTPLNNVVFAPQVLDEFSTNKVLMTEWVVGERLDKSQQSDVTILCSIAMNTYLTMMLETGVLHCDPHPGNLLRTPEGRLCILDWGMVTRLNPDLQITLIEHVAHLTSEDYAEIPKDLLLLDFIPAGQADLIEDSGVVETLAEIYGSWKKGGGAAKINVPKVVSQLQDLTATRGNFFQIPPYFAYIAKSFSVLEGIGLTNDPDYSIINECLPYISKRLLTDKSERAGGALSTFIFGAEKNNKDRIIDSKRAEQLLSGFGEYSNSASGGLLGQERSSRKQIVEDQADQILELLLIDDDKNITPLQNIVLEQLSKIISAGSRSVWTQVRDGSGRLPTGRTVLGTLVDPLGFWRTSPIVNVSELDEQTVESTRKLIELLQNDKRFQSVTTTDLSNQEILDVMSILVNKLWNKRVGVVNTGRKLFTNLIQLTADKLEEGERVRREIGNSSMNENKDKSKTDETVSNDQSRSGSGSERLTLARQLLKQLEDGRQEESRIEAVPVSNKR